MSSRLTTTEIAKLIRTDIKAALKAGSLPKGTKVSVRSEYFSMGSAIRVNITALPESVKLMNRVHIAFELAHPRATYWDMPREAQPRYTVEAQAILDKVHSIVLAYHVDNSTDSGGDKCWNVNFYESVGFDSDFTRADRARAELELAQPAPAPAPAMPPTKPRIVAHLVEWHPKPALRLVK
jgi:hypothetical protein